MTWKSIAEVIGLDWIGLELSGWYVLTCLSRRSLIQVQLNRAGFSSTPASFPSDGDGVNTAPLVRNLLLQIGETVSVWSRPAVAAAALGEDLGVASFCPVGLVSKESLSSGEEAIALAGAHVGLLRALLAKEGWSAPLMDCLREVTKYSCAGLYLRFEGPNHACCFLRFEGSNCSAILVCRRFFALRRTEPHILFFALQRIKLLCITSLCTLVAVGPVPYPFPKNELHLC